jgi:mRNA interferase MazF
LSGKIKQGEIWLADLNPGFGTEAGKVRPVVIVQTDFLNTYHPSTIICPITTDVQGDYPPLRIHLNKRNSGLEKRSDIMVDQIRAIDVKRLRRKVGKVSAEVLHELKYQLKNILDIK